MKEPVAGFEAHDVGADCKLWVGRLPNELIPSASAIEDLWNMHPQEFHPIKMHGRWIRIPRWQQAYGRDYFFTGTVSKALPIPSILEPFLEWTKQNIDANLNGLLLNWYDASLSHYIGPHHDNTKNLVPETPIVTISLGNVRMFRLRRVPAPVAAASIEFLTGNGTIFVIPWKTNLMFKHEVPREAKGFGRRISITVRAFRD